MKPVLVCVPGSSSRARRSSSSDWSRSALGRTRRYRRRTVSTLWLRISGWASITAASASQLPWKSGIRTSIEVPGQSARVRRMVSAKTWAPPSVRSSRSTEVMTACRMPIRAIDSATRRGSSSSSQVGRPVLTAQKAQARVQVSPRIMKVAVPALQHSPMLGQWASSHTVWRPSDRIRSRSLV